MDNLEFNFEKSPADRREYGKLYTAFDETKSLSEWTIDSRCQATYAALHSRINIQGWSIERAIRTPLKIKGVDLNGKKYGKLTVIKISSHCRPRSWQCYGEYVYNGVDRVNNDIVYTNENCITCCKICNTMKLNYSKEYFLSKIAKIYEKHCKNN